MNALVTSEAAKLKSMFINNAYAVDVIDEHVRKFVTSCMLQIRRQQHTKQILIVIHILVLPYFGLASSFFVKKES